MLLRPFEPTDTDYTNWAAIHNAVFPDEPMTPEMLRHDDGLYERIRLRFFAQTEDGTVIGTGVLRNPNVPWFYKRDRFLLKIGVLKEHRQQGIGAALYDQLMTAAQPHSPAEVYCLVNEAQQDAVRFIEKRGFELIQRDHESLLETKDYDFVRFEGAEDWLDKQGIEICTYTDLADDPDRDRKLYELDFILGADIPLPAGHEQTVTSLEEYIKIHSDANEDFIGDAVFVAVHEGAYVGICTLERSGGGRLYNSLTGVRREYRRKGIATALKLRSIAYAKANGGLPIVTSNEQDNPMYLLNVKLGFVAQPGYLTYLKT